MKKKREREKREENEREKNFSKKCFKTLKPARLISPQCFEKKSPSDELFLHFSFESSESDRVFNYIHDSNSIFRVRGINSEWIYGRTVLGVS